MSADPAREPGTWQTQIVVWDARDPSKDADPRFWWTAGEVARIMRASPPELAGRFVRAGTPKGQSLAKLREEFGDEVELRVGGAPDRVWRSPLVSHDVPLSPAPEHTVRFPLDHWRDADPAKTRMIVSHTWRAPADDREAMSAARRVPAAVDELRRSWAAALQTGDASEPALREQLDEELEAVGAYRLSRLSAWDPSRAYELAPGVWVQDERPRR